MERVGSSPFFETYRLVHSSATHRTFTQNLDGFIGLLLGFQAFGSGVARLAAFQAINLSVLARAFILAVFLFQKFYQFTAVNVKLLRAWNPHQALIPDPTKNRVRGDVKPFGNLINGIGIIPPDGLQRISVYLGHLSGLCHSTSFSPRKGPILSSFLSIALIGTRSNFPILIVGISPRCAAS